MADKTIKTRGLDAVVAQLRLPRAERPQAGHRPGRRIPAPDDPTTPGPGRTAGPARARRPRRPPARTPRPRPAGTGSPSTRSSPTGPIRIEYQAVHDTEHGQIVGFEALTRDPKGPCAHRSQLFAAAHAAGRLGELDWICRVTAFREMLDAGLPPSISLFVNVEADSLIEPCPPDLLPTVQEAEQRLRVYVDLDRPGDLPLPVPGPGDRAPGPGRELGRRHQRHRVQRRRRRRCCRPWNPTWSSSQPSAHLQRARAGQRRADRGDGRVRTHPRGAAGGAGGEQRRVDDRPRRRLALPAGPPARQARARCRSTCRSRCTRSRCWSHPDPDEALSTPWSVLSTGGARQTSNVSQAGLDHLIMGITTRAAVGDQAPAVAVVIPAAAATMAPERQVMFTMLLERCPLIIIVGPNVSAWSDWRVRAADMPVGHAFAHETCFVVLSPGLSMAVAGRPHGWPQDPPVWDIAVSQNPDVCRTVMRQILRTVDTLAGGVHHHG